MADEKRTQASVFIPEVFSRAVIDYVRGCRWCDYDSRSNPVHHKQCPRGNLVKTDG